MAGGPTGRCGAGPRPGAAGRLVERFDRLRAGDVERLAAFFARDDLLVKGTDTTPARTYRGGCLPYLLLTAAGVVGWQGGELLGLSRPVHRGVGLSMAVIATTWLVRGFVAARRSRRLLSAPGGWHGLAWTADEVAFRSLHSCCLVPWSDVQDVVLVDEGGPLLQGTLWLHLPGREKVLIEPRSEDGRFAGRAMADWRDDLLAARRAAMDPDPTA